MTPAERREKILAVAAEVVAAGRAFPSNPDLAEALGCNRTPFQESLKALTRGGALKVQVAGGRRRVSLDGERWSAWSGAGAPSPGKRGRRGARPAAETVREVALRVQRQVLGLLAVAADEGSLLPTVKDIAAAVGATEGKVDSAIRHLRLQNQIHIETVGNQRRAVIASTGKATAWSNPGQTPQGIDRSLLNPTWVIPAAPRNGGKDWPAWSTCQWLDGEARDRNFCGAPVKEGSSYCEHHHAVVFIPPQPMEIAA